jgi:hypothetical protein
MSKDHFSVDIIDVNDDDNNNNNNNIELQEKKAEFGVTPISKEEISVRIFDYQRMEDRQPAQNRSGLSSIMKDIT